MEGSFIVFICNMVTGRRQEFVSAPRHAVEQVSYKFPSESPSPALPSLLAWRSLWGDSAARFCLVPDLRCHSDSLGICHAKSSLF